jgi:hypothetical protein
MTEPVYQTEDELLGRIEEETELLSLLTLSILNLATGNADSSLHEITSMVYNDEQTEVVMLLTQVGSGEKSRITIEELKESE